MRIKDTTCIKCVCVGGGGGEGEGRNRCSYEQIWHAMGQIHYICKQIHPYWNVNIDLIRFVWLLFAPVVSVRRWSVLHPVSDAIYRRKAST